MKNNFREKQKFTQWWIWLILVGILVKRTHYISSNMLDEGEVWNEILPVLFRSSIIPLLVIIFIFLIKLNTSVDKFGVRIKFFPLVTKKYLWSEIESFEVISYPFLFGFGIRSSLKYGTVYNIRGNKGLFLKLKNNKKILIGTQKVSELKKFLKSHKLSERS